MKNHIDIWLGNLGKYVEGELIGEWINLPITAEEFQESLNRIGINKEYEEYFIADFDTAFGADLHIGEYSNIEELNYLAGRLNELSEYELEVFESALSLGNYTDYGTIKGIINLTYNLDCYLLYSGVLNEYDLGYYWIEESGTYNTEAMGHLSCYIDYESFGRDIALDEGGHFGSFGYIYSTGESGTDIYNGDRDDIPEEYKLYAEKEQERDVAEVKEKLSKKGYER